MKGLKLCLLGIFFCFYGSFQLNGQSALTEDLRQDIEALFAEYQVQPGCNVGIMQNGKIIYQQSFGFANLDYDIKMQAETVFETASITKQVTAACIHLLAQEGKIKLDDPIRKYIPEIPVYKEGVITVRQLLHHTSGLRDYLALIHLSGSSWDIPFDEAQALAILERQRELCFTPGTKYAYSNSGYLLLGIMIKRLSGKSLAAYAQEHLFEPLGMTHTFIYEDAHKVVKNRAIGYSDEGEGMERNHYFNFISIGDGGMYTTIGDFFKWSENYNKNRTALKDFNRKMLERGVLNNGDTISYAMGVEHGTFMGADFYGHNGSWGGNRGMFLQYPESGLTLITLSNNGSINVWSKTYDLAGLLLQQEMEQEIAEEGSLSSYTPPKTIRLSTEELQAYCKNYFDPESAYVRRIYLKNDTLYYSRSATNETPLAPVAANEFIMLGTGSNVRVRFEQSESEGELMFVSVNDNPPFKHIGFESASYKEKAWKNFVGQYTTPSVAADFSIQKEEDHLVLFAGSTELARFDRAMRNVFYSAHLGYITFEEGGHAFTIKDDALGLMRFEKK